MSGLQQVCSGRSFLQKWSTGKSPFETPFAFGTRILLDQGSCQKTKPLFMSVVYRPPASLFQTLIAQINFVSTFTNVIKNCFVKKWAFLLGDFNYNFKFCYMMRKFKQPKWTQVGQGTHLQIFCGIWISYGK